jgi:hypothetical protein
VFDFLVEGHMCDELLNAEGQRTRLSTLQLAVKHADLDFTRRLLALGARETGFGSSPLHAACAVQSPLSIRFAARSTPTCDLLIRVRGVTGRQQQTRTDGAVR